MKKQKEFQSIEVKKENYSKILEIWSELGLTTQIKSAIAMHLVTQHILANISKFGGSKTEVLVFPILRKIYQGESDDFDLNKLKNEVIEICNYTYNNEHIATDISYPNGVDLEAVWVKSVADKFKKIYNKD